MSRPNIKAPGRQVSLAAFRQAGRSIFHAGLLTLMTLVVSIASGQDRELIVVVNQEDGTAAPYTNVRAWGHSYTSPPKPNIPDLWHPLSNGPTDMGGSRRIEIPDKLKVTSLLVVAWNEDRSRGGFFRLGNSTLKSTKMITVQLTATRTIDVELTRLYNDSPIADCNVGMQFGGGVGEKLDSGLSWQTDSDGKFKLDGIIPGLNSYLTWEHPEYYSGPKAYPKVGDEPRIQYQLLSELDHDRALEAAKLAMPKVSGLHSKRQFEVLTSRLEEIQDMARQDTGNRAPKHPGKNRVFQLRVEPTDVYMRTIWELVDKEEETDVLAEMLVWLKNQHELSRDVRIEISKRMVDKVSKSTKLKNSAQFIRSFHPTPIDALKRLLDENPNPETQGRAAKMLVYCHSPRLHMFAVSQSDEPLMMEDFRDRQNKRVHYSKLILEKYGEIQDYGQRTLKEFATQDLHWVSQFGLDATVPELQATTTSGKNFRLSANRGTPVVIHFLDSSSTPSTVRELETFAKSKSIEVVGIVNKKHKSLVGWIDENEPKFPILVDAYQGMVRRNRVFMEDPDGLHWATDKLARFQRLSPLVLDSEGKLVSVGQEMKDVAKLIDRLKSQE